MGMGREKLIAEVYVENFVVRYLYRYLRNEFRITDKRA
jgi:hypothetical protein